MLQLAAALAIVSVALALEVYARMIWTSEVREAADAIREFAHAIAQHREREGYLPGDINGDGEIDALETGYVAPHLARAGLIPAGATEFSVSIGGRRVTLRAISRQASRIRGFPEDVRNVVELTGLPCEAAKKLDSQKDDGASATGNIRTNVAVCAAGGLNDPVVVVAVAMRP